MDLTPSSPASAPVADASSELTARRSLLTFALAATAVPLTAALTESDAEAASNGSLPTIYPGWVKRNFAEIRTNEQSHLEIVTTAIRLQGGTPRPKPTFRILLASTPAQFAAMSASFCNLGAAAYYGGGGYIDSPDVAKVATSLALVEAYQSGFLNTLLNEPLIPNRSTYQVAATPAQAVAMAGPYIVNLNDNGAFPPTYAEEKSATNDIAILNFALLLEYLENEFYDTNVTRLFNV